jgi:hypothetical protein
MIFQKILWAGVAKLGLCPARSQLGRVVILVFCRTNLMLQRHPASDKANQEETPGGIGASKRVQHSQIKRPDAGHSGRRKGLVPRARVDEISFVDELNIQERDLGGRKKRP